MQGTPVLVLLMILYYIVFGRSGLSGEVVAIIAFSVNFGVYASEIISMVKMTSIVGYVAVLDLTKVSDIIRSRTMEAFFPLIATAILYFVIANVLTGVLSYCEKKTNPKRRPRKINGVN